MWFVFCSSFEFYLRQKRTICLQDFFCHPMPTQQGNSFFIYVTTMTVSLQFYNSSTILFVCASTVSNFGFSNILQFCNTLAEGIYNTGVDCLRFSIWKRTKIHFNFFYTGRNIPRITVQCMTFVESAVMVK